MSYERQGTEPVLPSESSASVDFATHERKVKKGFIGPLPRAVEAMKLSVLKGWK